MGKAKKATEPAARRGADSAPKLDGEALAGEMRQLAVIRAHFPALPSSTAAAMLAHHDADVCRVKGTATRATDTFRIAMAWARTFGEHRDDPAVRGASVCVRWFLDCLIALGAELSAKAAATNPVRDGALRDATLNAELRLRRATRRARDAAGTERPKLDALDRALSHDGVGDATVARIRRLAALLDDWRGSSSGIAATLEVYGVTADTVRSLRDAAQTLEEAIARRPAQRQIDRDTPAINTLEGRLYLVMRPLWDELAEAREDGATSLQLSVSPTLLRGLELYQRRTKPTPETRSTPTPVPTPTEPGATV